MAVNGETAIRSILVNLVAASIFTSQKASIGETRLENKRCPSFSILFGKLLTSGYYAHYNKARVVLMKGG